MHTQLDHTAPGGRAAATATTLPAMASFRAGALRTIPFVLAVLPFGIIYGVLAVELGLTSWQAICFSLLAFAGAAQVAGLQLLADHAPLWVAAGTALVVNLRYFMYSASIAVHLQGLPMAAKIPLAYLLTDQSYLVSVARYAEDTPVRKAWFYFGSASACWCAWQTGVVTGSLVGARIPGSLELDFGIPLVFIGMAVPVLKSRPALMAALVASVMSVAAFDLPLSLGIVAASCCGIATGTWLDARKAA